MKPTTEILLNFDYAKSILLLSLTIHMKKQLIFLLVAGLMSLNSLVQAQLNPKRWQGTWKVLNWEMADQDLVDVLGSKPANFVIIINEEANRVKLNGLSQGTFSSDLVVKATGKSKLISQETVRMLDEAYKPLVELKLKKGDNGPTMTAMLRFLRNNKAMTATATMIREVKIKAKRTQ